MVKTLKQILTMFVDSSHSNWDWFLQASLSAYNTTVHSSLKFSPYEVLFGRKPKIVADVILAKPVDEQELDMNDYVVKLKNNASRLREVVNNNLKKAYEKQKFQYDKFVHMGKQFEVGDLVLVRNEKNKVGESKCFKERAIGPFQIMDKFNSVNFRIINLSNGKEQTIHYNRLLQYNQRVGSEFLISNQVNNEKVNEARRLDPQKSLFDVDDGSNNNNNRRSNWSHYKYELVRTNLVNWQQMNQQTARKRLPDPVQSFCRRVQSIC